MKWIDCAIGMALAHSLFLAGCGSRADAGPKVYPVSGKLLVNGQPAPRAEITLHPSVPINASSTSPGGEEASGRPVKPFAVVEADGTFRPSTWVSGDGAPPGEYTVTVVWPKVTLNQGEEITGPDQLGGRYSDPQHPIQKITIHEGENVLPPIELKTR